MVGRGDAGAFAVVLLAAIAGPPPTAGDEPPYPAFDVRIRHAPTAATVESALRGAARRLLRPECRAVFADFKDAAGRPLSERLVERQTTPQGYLGQVIFYDGLTQPRCQARSEGPLAVTAPGSPVVFVCPETLRAQYRRQPFYVEATLIHEAMHTLGLGENPPTSREITSRVLSRCGR